MSRDYVVHLTPITGMIASVRIAAFLAKTLHLPGVVTNPLECDEALEEGIKTLIVVNGPPAFCRFRDELAEAVRRCETWVWVQNDYMIYPPSQVNKAARERGWVNERGVITPPHVWSTLPDRGEYINWNALTMSKPVAWGRRPGEFIYYGAWRLGREERYHRYIPRGAVISCPSRARERFKELGKTLDFIEPFDDLVKELSRYQATVLIQDGRSDKRFMSLPNRFYECLSAGVAQFISQEMVASVRQAGYEVENRWVVSRWQDIDVKLARKIAGEQQAAWGDRAMKERSSLPAKVRRAYERLRSSK